MNNLKCETILLCVNVPPFEQLVRWFGTCNGAVTTPLNINSNLRQVRGLLVGRTYGASFRVLSYWQLLSNFCIVWCS